MIKRVIDISSPAKLSVKRAQLIITRETEPEPVSVPIEDIGVLLISSPHTLLSLAVHTHCAANGAVIVFCDESYQPVAALHPYSNHSLTARITREQSAVKAPVKKRLWQQVVKQKVAEQGVTIERAKKDAQPIRGFIERVRSGDSTNVEAQAARWYWKTLFGPDFRRDPESEGINSALNYGYAVVRAAVSRAIVGAGLSPIFGVQHSNQFNPFALADDLMEPFRPWVDEVVYLLAHYRTPAGGFVLDRSVREPILSLLSMPCSFDGRELPFMTALHSYCARFRELLIGEERGGRLDFPQR